MTLKIYFHGVPLLDQKHMVCKIQFHAENYIFKPFTIDIFFLYKICELLVYSMLTPNLAPIWQQSHGLFQALRNIFLIQICSQKR